MSSNWTWILLVSGQCPYASYFVPLALQNREVPASHCTPATLKHIRPPGASSPALGA